MPKPSLSEDQRVELGKQLIASLPKGSAFFLGVIRPTEDTYFSVISNIEPDQLTGIFHDLANEPEPIVERESYGEYKLGKPS